MCTANGREQSQPCFFLLAVLVSSLFWTYSLNARTGGVTRLRDTYCAGSRLRWFLINLNFVPVRILQRSRNNKKITDDRWMDCNFGGWEVPWSAACEVETQESQRCDWDGVQRPEKQGHQFFLGLWIYLGPLTVWTKPALIGEGNLLRPPIQILMSSRNILTQTYPGTMFNLGTPWHT